MTTTNSSVSTTLPSNVDNLVLTGTADINGTGNGLDNEIIGNAGANVLNGAGGADTLVGGAGNDTYVVDNSGDTVVESAAEGTDTVQSGVSYTLPSDVENLTLTGTADIDGTGNELGNVINGNAGANVIDGQAGNDTLSGNAGNDTLVGGAGNDVLDGGAGADQMQGGAGDDTYVVDNAADAVLENEGEGSDTVQSSVNHTLSDNVENLTLTGGGNTSGTGNALDNTITGNQGSNTLSGMGGNDTLAGGAGNDTLDGGAGADNLQGGGGDDTYVVDETGDTVTEAARAGTDTVQSGIDYTLGANVENLSLTGSDSLNGTGNALNNVITGNGGDNTIAGAAGDDALNAGAGNDAVSGGDGNDTLNGGQGADQMQGGAGDDTYVVDDAGDIVAEDSNAGTDQVQSGIDYTLTDNVENLTLSGTADIDGNGNELGNVINGNSGANVLDGLAGNDTLNGNAGNDTLAGGEGNDLLDGGTGADTMQGGTGDDTYIADNTADVVVESQGEGTDTVQSSANHTLTDNVENLTLTGGGSTAGTGNTLDNTITGNQSSNSLNGLDGNDTLVDDGGNDTLDGGAGADNMQGGSGSDTYVVDDALDTVTEAAGAGNDTVASSIDYTLGANVENLSLTGTDNLSGTGNSLNNVITGNGGDNTIASVAGDDTVNAGAGNDTVSGGDGNDTLGGDAGADLLLGDAGNDLLNGGTGGDEMQGGSGNDTYVVDDDGDIVIEGSNAGTDHVQSGITDTLTDNVENLSLTGTADIDGTGNELGNIINGNSGANVLDGQAGNDILNGNSGHDSLVGGEGDDILNGHVGDDQLAGDAGNDLLDGGTGADNMQGGTGDDTYIVDNAADAVAENEGEGTDTVQSSVTHTLTDNVENLTLTGGADISGAGNALDNTITGNSGSNTLSGLDGNDTLVGSWGGDTLDGGTGADHLQGGGGNDTYIVDNAGDTVSETMDAGTDNVQSSVDHTLTANVENLTLTGTDNLNGTGNSMNNVITGNSGNNTISSLAGNDTVNAGAGNDVVSGGDGSDALGGEAGDDQISGDAGNDLVSAGAGNDTVSGGEGDDRVYGDDGNDQISGDAGHDVVSAGAGNDVVSGGEGNDWLLGDAGDDQLLGDTGNDLLDGGTGGDQMQGGSGNDTYVVDDGGDIVIEDSNAGTDHVQSSITDTLTDNVENLTLTGTADIDGTGNELGNIINGNSGANVLDGLAGNDTINGNAGNDSLIGGEGNDLLDGGAGADNMQGGSGDDTYIVDNAADTVAENQGDGSDTVQSSVSHTLSDNVENLTLTGGSNTSGTGNALDNVITGNQGSNTLSGLGGNDTLVGDWGNDTLDGGAGADNLQGGGGNDTYVVDEAGDTVTEAAGAGNDTVASSIDYTLGANVENLNLTGTDNLDGTGNALNNVITGNSGNNVIDGAAGIDAMAGGAGDDTYIVDATADAITEGVGGGEDIAYSSANYTLSANVEDLVLTGSTATHGTGNAQDNTITGNTANNVLSGMAGDDLMSGGEGNDLLDGGAGADAMAGGTGNDTYVVDNTADAVIEAEGEGVDTVQSSISQTLSSTVENLSLTGSGNIDGTGNALDNVITGNSGNNVLDGQGGGDTLVGGAGNDTYVVDSGDTVVEAAGGGVDTVQSSIDHTLAANVENLTLTGNDNVDGTGNALNNVIKGTAGDNVIDGGAGADTMAGGAGDDTYVVDATADAIVEAGASGTDTVLSSANYTLSANVENLVLTGTASTSGTGNAQDNTITGNAGNNLLDGGAGADAMAGGTGNDTYVVDNAADAVIEAEGEGVDTVQSSISQTLSSTVENLTLTGSANIDGTGNAQDNLITGNSGNNVLDGQGGGDTLVGGAGDDTYVVDGADTVVEAAGGGVDTVQSSIDHTLAAHVENLTLTGGDDVDGTGNALNNLITGTSGDNVIDGGAGADTMAGGAGDDTYVVDATADAIVEAADGGTDTALSSASTTLAANVENLVLTGTASTSGTGNAQDNTITGNAGNNQLDGGAGADAMAGGTGNDTYIVDDAGDTVTEAQGAGTDTVQSSVSQTLSAHVENLSLTGTGNIDGSGNALDNVIIGNGGNNVLDGQGGGDTLVGGAGDDTYVVDGADTVVETAGDGIDTVQAGTSLTLGANVENLVLTGAGDATGTGNELDNAISGNAGANVLEGGAGADTLSGGAGTDTLAGGAGDDSYQFGIGDGNDRIVDFEGSDTLYFRGGLTARDLDAEQEGDDLVFLVRNTSDSLTLINWFNQTGGVGQLVFEDGSTFDHTGIIDLLNSPPVAVDDEVTVAEDDGQVAIPLAALLGNDTDPDPDDQVSVISVGQSQVGATVTLGADQVQYDLGGKFEQLAEGEVLEDSFSYTVSDIDGETASAVVKVRIVGVNDGPVAVGDTAAMTEDQRVVGGNVLANDSDVDAGTVLKASAGIYTGQYGVLALAEDGRYVYTLATGTEKVQSLGRGASVVEHFQYTATDGIASVVSTLDLTIGGLNDAPVVAMALADTYVNFNKAFSFQIPAGSFKDVDQGDTLTYSATLADGSALPSWLVFDAATGTFSGKAPKQESTIEVRVTATDKVAATGSTVGSLSVSDVFKLTVSHGNQGVGNGQDAASPGHGTNFNDGPGTGPGNPGAKGGNGPGSTAVVDFEAAQALAEQALSWFEESDSDGPLTLVGGSGQPLAFDGIWW